METSIASETISQQTICGEPENIEITNDTEPKLPRVKNRWKLSKLGKI